MTIVWFVIAAILVRLLAQTVGAGPASQDSR